MTAVQTSLPLEPGAARCCRCLADSHPDGSPVSWRCAWCSGPVCRACTLTDPGEAHRTYYDDTLCSQGCKDLLDRSRAAYAAAQRVMES